MTNFSPFYIGGETFRGSAKDVGVELKERGVSSPVENLSQRTTCVKSSSSQECFRCRQLRDGVVSAPSRKDVVELYQKGRCCHGSLSRVEHVLVFLTRSDVQFKANPFEFP